MVDLKDVQSEKDFRNIPVDKAGVRNVIYPIVVLDRKNGTQETVGKFVMSVNLPHDLRGAHMSRFLEILNRHRKKINLRNMERILDEMKEGLQAESAHLQIEFPYFIKKRSPVSKAEGYMNYNCKFIASKDNRFDFILEVDVPIHTLCPCSKEISSHSAHNQRAVSEIQVRMNTLVWIEELIEIAEECGSSPLYSIIKREDERYLTEHAYDNPRFVEDVTREIALRLERDERIKWYSIYVISYESIHTHDAYASITKNKNELAHLSDS